MEHTESSSSYDHLESMSTADILESINAEDQTVAGSVKAVIPSIQDLVDAVAPLLIEGGRLFYIGSGTSGRLGIVDASECPPTFGVSHDVIIGIIAGGDSAIRKAVEFAEDSADQAWKDLQPYKPSNGDALIGIAASGSTPYVVGGVRMARQNGLVTGGITCNLNTALAAESEYPIECVVGPEFITGSTRMKAGTAQKLILNMISTSLMIKLGRVKGNRMVDMQLSNNKLVRRGVRMIMEELKVDENQARKLLDKYGSVREALKASIDA